MFLPFASSFFFFTDPAPTEIYTLSLHDALPICHDGFLAAEAFGFHFRLELQDALVILRNHFDEAVHHAVPVAQDFRGALDRKSTRLNSSHPSISYAVFCLKKKKKNL